MEYMNRLLTLPPEDYYQQILELAVSTAPLDKYEVENAVSGLYALLNLPTPQIIYCQSPWQMSLIPILKGFFTSAGPFDADQVQKEIQELAKDKTDFFQLGVAALESACRTTSMDNAGRLLLEECHQLFLKVLNEAAPLADQSAEDPAMSETELTIEFLEFAAILTETFGRTIVPSDDIGTYLYSSGSHRVSSGRSPSRCGEYFKALYRKFYYRLEKIELPPIDFVVAKSEDYALVGDLNLFTKTSAIGLWARYIYNQRLLSPTDYVKQILAMMLELIRAAHDYLPFENVCLVSKRPQVVQLDHQMRLHFDTDAALRYSDGYAVYAVEGVVVPAWLIDSPREITATKIIEEKNTELRRIMLRRFGEARYIKEIGAQEIQQDSAGRLYRAQFPTPGEDLVMVRVENSTPEKDGSRKVYWLRVPPTITTAKEGVAWSFGMESAEYEPTKSS